MDGSSDPVSRRRLLSGRFGPKQDSGWFAVDGVSAGPGDVFWAAWADQEGAFVAGDDGVIFGFSGEDWTREVSPVPVPIHAFWGTDRTCLWAVGWMGLILRYDGANWHHQRGCTVDGAGKYPAVAENTPLFDVCGLDNGHCWAVGDRGVILHFDGSDWAPEESGSRVHLRSIIALSDGRIVASGGDGTVLVRGADSVWNTVSCPGSSNFTGSLELADGEVLFAGGRYLADANGFRGDLILWDGRTFDKLYPNEEFSRFRALAQSKNGVLVVGDTGQIHMVRDERIDRIHSGTGHDLLGIATLPTGEALAVGDFGTILVADTNSSSLFAPTLSDPQNATCWEPMESGSDRQLWGLWYDDHQEMLYACGEEGTVLCLDRGQWETLPPAGALGIHDLTRSLDGGLLAAGQLGEIHRFDGESWRKDFDLLMDVTLLSLWSDRAGTIFAAGDEGLVLRWAGETWERMPSGTKSALYGLWGRDAEHLLAVGDFGQVMRWNGKRWDEFNAGTEHFLFDVWGRALDDIFVVGLSGTIGHFNGRHWQITPARARHDLLAVTGTASNVFAVGAGGTAARFDGIRWQMDPTGVTLGLRDVAVDHNGHIFAAGDRGTILRREPA